MTEATAPHPAVVPPAAPRPVRPPVPPPVRAAALHEYMTRTGWVRKPFPNPLGAYFEHSTVRTDDGQPFPQLVAATEDVSGYADSVALTVQALSMIEGRPAEAIWRDLGRPDPVGAVAAAVGSLRTGGVAATVAAVAAGAVLVAAGFRLVPVETALGVAGGMGVVAGLVVLVTLAWRRR